jgi:LysR family transcriptional regulator, hypochlorite-specific transcription factor HypT
MELKWLEDLTALARSGSFSEAANDRNVTQSALSKRIRALEQWLGVTLVNRAVYPVVLTPHGQEFLAFARETISGALTIRKDFRQAMGSNKNQVRILTLHTLAVRVVPEIFAPMMAADPEMAIEIVPSIQGVESHFDSLESEHMHILLAYSQHKTAARSKQYDEKIVAIDELVPVASRSYIDAGGVTDLRRGKKIPVLVYSPFTFSAGILEKTMAGIQERVYVRAESPLSETLKPLVLQGLGIAWLPRTGIEDELRTGALHIVADQKFSIPLEICAWRRLDLVDRRAIRAFEQLQSLENKT